MRRYALKYSKQKGTFLLHADIFSSVSIKADIPFWFLSQFVAIITILSKNHDCVDILLKENLSVSRKESSFRCLAIPLRRVPDSEQEGSSVKDKFFLTVLRLINP